MANPYVNKVQLADGTSLIDISADTVTAADVSVGVTFHLGSGATGTGTLPNGNNLEYGYTDGSLPIVGVAIVGSAHAWSDSLTEMVLGTGTIGTGRVV